MGGANGVFTMLLLAVVEAHCRYLYPARYDDQVLVRTWIEEASPRMVRFGLKTSF